MALVSVAHAARDAGISRSTLYRYIKSGKVDVTQADDGSNKVETVQVLRVVEQLKQVGKRMVEEKENERAVSQDNSDQLHLLQRQLNQVKAAHEEAAQKVAYYEKENEQLRMELNAARSQLEKLQSDELMAQWVDGKMATVNRVVTRVSDAVREFLHNYGKGTLIALFVVAAVSWLFAWEGLLNVSFSLAMLGVFIYVMHMAAEKFREHYRNAINRKSG